MGECAGRLACDFFDKLRRLGADGGEDVVRLQIVEIAGDGTDILVDRPFVVIEHDYEPAGGSGDVVKSLERGAAGKGGISGDGHHMVVIAREVTCCGHAEGGGERGAGVACAIGIVLGFRAQ